MNSSGRHKEKTGYLVMLLLVVGLTAFSNSMKELAQIHELTADAGRLIAQWSNDIAPAEVPQIPPIPQVSETPQAPPVVVKLNTCQNKAEKVERRVVRVGPSEDELTKLQKLRIRFNARDREILLKTLNRSINVRIAS